VVSQKKCSWSTLTTQIEPNCFCINRPTLKIVSKICRRHKGLKFSLNRKNTCISYLKEGLSDQTTWTRANACRVASRPCRRIPTLKIVSKIHRRYGGLKFSLNRNSTCISYLKEGLSDQTTWTRANACRVSSRPCRRIFETMPKS
jgi:hypothetical protein